VADPTRRAYLALRHRDYRLLWSANSISAFGTQMQRVAVGWQVFVLTHDPLQLGLLGLVRFFPVLVVGLAGGVIADRYDRRRTLVATQFALMLTSATLAITTVNGSISMPLIYAMTFLAACVSAISNPTQQALLPALVPRRELAGAVTLGILASQTASITGPAIGGIIVGHGGLAIAYGLDALSFAVVIGAVILMRVHAIPAPMTTRGIGAIKEGLRFLWGVPILLGVMAIDFVATFFGASTTLMPIFADEILRIGASGLGLLLSAPAVGAVLGSLVMSAMRVPKRPGLGIVVAIMVYGGCLAGFGVSRYLPLSLLLLAGSGAADAVSMALRATIRNLITPDHFRGRVAAAHSTFAMGGPQLGEFESGLIASWIGVSWAVLSGGLLTMVSCLIMVRKVPTITTYRVDDDPAIHQVPPEVVKEPAPATAVRDSS
jgi:MFS family permease